jgi:molybdopterin converting factor subunit 1
VHPGPNLTKVEENLEHFAVGVRQELQKSGDWPADVPLGVGLWLSDQASQELLASGRLSEFRRKLEQQQLIPITMNGFPQGNFHLDRVKHQVYLPTWWDPARRQYTSRLIEILDQLLPPGTLGSISTLPLAWSKPEPTDAEFAEAARQLSMIADQLADLEEKRGRQIVLAIEPEPGCSITDSPSLRRFFERWLLKQPARQRILRYLTVCHDICHAAVMWEEQATEFAEYRQLGMRVGKVQVSSALEIDWDGKSAATKQEAVAALRSFAEDRYLHQTTVRPSSTVSPSLHEDLPALLDTVSDPSRLSGSWRVHFHVPIFHREAGVLSTTQPEIGRCLEALLGNPGETVGGEAFFTGHLEVETYAWTVLPPALRGRPLTTDIADELRYLRQQLSVCGSALGSASTAAAVGEATVTAVGEATVTTVGEATVTAVGEATVTAVGEATVTEVGEATVTEVGEATVTEVGEATVTEVGEATVLLFAAARQILGANSIALPLPAGATVSTLRQLLAERYPPLRELLASSRFAVDQEFAEDDQIVTGAREIALIPPVSGG